MKAAELLGQRVEALLKRRKWSQRDLARKLARVDSFVSDITNGKSNTTLDELDNLARVLEVGVDDLFIDRDQIRQTLATQLVLAKGAPHDPVAAARYFKEISEASAIVTATVLTEATTKASPEDRPLKSKDARRNRRHRKRG